jgi:hypothetical protein
MLEEGYIKRGQYWSVTIGEPGPNKGYLHPNITPDRIHDITSFQSFRRNPTGIILLTRQLPRDANIHIEAHEYREWAYSKFASLKKRYPQHEVVARDHPREVKQQVETIDDVLKDTCALFTYSSNTAVDAAIHGVPFNVEGTNSLVKELSLQDPVNDELPSYQEQEWVLNNVAHAQWSIEEMQNGTCWNHVQQVLAYEGWTCCVGT